MSNLSNPYATIAISVLDDLRVEITLANGSTYKSQADNRDLKQALGFGAGDWPAEGIAPTMLGNVLVEVKPRAPKRTNANGYAIKSSKHRMVARCPYCDRQVSGGRLRQHFKGCDLHAVVELMRAWEE